MQRTLIDQLSFGFRANALRLRRRFKDLRNGPAWLPRTQVEGSLDIDWPIVAGASQTPLWPSSSPAEYGMTAGKIQNLRLAVRRLDGLRIPTGAIFSFWRHVGRPVRARGFVPGRELREGCLIASIGGGLCQLSNSLYAAAKEAGCEIIERHRHSQIIPGSLAERDLDATVFWNYVDLRFRAGHEMVVEARLTPTDLIVRLRRNSDDLSRETEGHAQPRAAPGIDRDAEHAPPGDCLSCGMHDCAYHSRAGDREHGTAWLLDARWPEFDHWLQRYCQPQDVFHLPLDGQAWHRPNYAWHLPSQNRRHSYPFLTLMQAMGMRRLASQGAARQSALLERDRRLASAYTADLAYQTSRLVVAQNLLPHLWLSGALGGRQYAVLMTRAPLAELQQTLDQAAAIHPLSPTLRDFRAPGWLLAAEQSALQSASSLITPHWELAGKLASQYEGTVERLDWHLPTATGRRMEANDQGDHLVFFAGASLARKGAYEMRAAARQLPIRLRVLGGAMETADFWRGIKTERTGPDNDPLAGVSCVVLPAFVEYQPRLVLLAVARGIPVICSRACGLSNRPGVTLVTAGDSASLAAAVAAIISR